MGNFTEGDVHGSSTAMIVMIIIINLVIFTKYRG